MMRKGGCFVCCVRSTILQTKNISKVYNLIPAQRLKTNALKYHSKSAQHAAAEEQVKSKDEVLQNAFMSVYWLTKEMANKFVSLLTLLQMLGLENMKHFCHRPAGLTIDIYMKQEVVEVLRKSKAFGLLVDEVTDISVMEQLIGFAQYVSDNGEAMVKFLSLDNVLED